MALQGAEQQPWPLPPQARMPSWGPHMSPKMARGLGAVTSREAPPQDPGYPQGTSPHPPAGGQGPAHGARGAAPRGRKVIIPSAKGHCKDGIPGPGEAGGTSGRPLVLVDKVLLRRRCPFLPTCPRGLGGRRAERPPQRLPGCEAPSSHCLDPQTLGPSDPWTPRPSGPRREASATASPAPSPTTSRVLPR